MDICPQLPLISLYPRYEVDAKMTRKNLANILEHVPQNLGNPADVTTFLEVKANANNALEQTKMG